MPTTISPDMNLPIPVVGEDPGPDWAENVNACLNIVDGHTHTSGSGVPITPEAIDINSELAMNANDLITTRTVRFTPQSAVLNGAADLGCLYEVDEDLYYNDGSGNQVRLTQSGAPAGATGTITGLPSGTASASFSGTTFSFKSSTNTPATMNVGPVTLGQAVASGYAVSITANPSQAANYGVVLPVALPSVASLIKSDTSGNLSFVASGANVRASEGAGTTTLTSSDNLWQIFNTSAARVCVLPSTGITAGQCIKIENVGSGGTLEVQSSNTNTLCYVNSLYSSVELVALQASPTTSAHWKVNFAYNRFQYLWGTAYYSGITPSITASAGSLTVWRASFIPYQTQNGIWRMNVDMTLQTASVVAPGVLSLYVNGITIKNVGGPQQTIAAQAIGLNPATASCRAVSNSDEFQIFPGSTSTDWAISGDVELNSKPTWAY